MVRLLRGIYFWAMGLLVTSTLFLFACVRHWLTRFEAADTNGRPVHAVASLWGKALIELMPGWRVTIEGRENLPADGTPVVMVANHESMADIWAMYYLGVQFRWLSKKEVFKLPLIGKTMRWAGYVSVDRKNRESGVEAMRQSAARLKQGLAMFFFPEGTRSEDGRIKPFKLGAFKLAYEERVPIIPIAIHGAGDLFPKGSALPGKHAHIRIKILPQVRPPIELEAKSLDGFASQIRDQIIAAHASII